MSIGLFLDVDNTLTVGFIQQRFAALLGVEREYRVIEEAFQLHEISSPEFGRQIITLFNAAGFNRAFAEEHYSDVEQAPWADDLLLLPATKYLVSSGPSYFVGRFAQQHAIPENNVLCSEYIFSPDGILDRCKAVTGPHKQDFVTQRAAQHFITIGVGDSFLHDGPFVTACDIPILTEIAPGMLTVESLETVRTLVYKLSRRGMSVPRSKPTLFIGSSTEQIHVATALHTHLERYCDPTVWKDGVFEPSKVFIESLEHSLSNFDFASLILAPDDITSSRGISEPAVRDNILFELGLFIGRLGRERCFMLHPRGVPMNLPSDLSGVVMLDYPADRAATDPGPALTTCADQMRRIIGKYGCRGLKL